MSRQIVKRNRGLSNVPYILQSRMHIVKLNPLILSFGQKTFWLSTYGWQDQQSYLLSSSSFLHDNPYTVLKVPVGSSYEIVKKAFITAALQYHPDHNKNNKSNEDNKSTEEFIRIRKAFEQIVSSKSTSEKYNAEDDRPVWRNDEEFYQWFQQVTSEHLTFEMNHQTRQEVIHVYRTMSSGGRDRGGYWEMARQLAEREDAFRQAGGQTVSVDTDKSPFGQEVPTPTPHSSIRRKRTR